MTAPLISDPTEMRAVLDSCTNSLHALLTRFAHTETNELFAWQWQQEADAVTRTSAQATLEDLNAQWRVFLRLSQRESDLRDLRTWLRHHTPPAPDTTTSTPPVGHRYEDPR